MRQVKPESDIYLIVRGKWNKSKSAEWFQLHKWNAQEKKNKKLNAMCPWCTANCVVPRYVAIGVAASQFCPSTPLYLLIKWDILICLYWWSILEPHSSAPPFCLPAVLEFEPITCCGAYKEKRLSLILSLDTTCATLHTLFTYKQIFLCPSVCLSTPK